MKVFLPLFVVLGLLAFSTGCKEENTGHLELNFKAFYGADPLVMLQEYSYTDSMTMLFQRFNFYVSDIQLVEKGTGDKVLIKDIDFVNFDNVNSPDDAAEGYSLHYGEIPVGEYESIIIGLGVPADLNATAASDYSDDHPLGMDSHYWSAWGSYIFTMINGKLDTDGDGQHDDSSVLYHAGNDQTYRTKTITIPINITEEGEMHLHFNIDLQRVFLDPANGELIDVIANPATHDITDLTLANIIQDNLKEALIPVE